MRIPRLDPADGDAIRACFDTREAGRADDPFKPPESLRVFRTDLFSVWDGSPAEAWYAPDPESSAALTAVSVDPDIPEWGRQWATTVTRPHRGHRLGLLVKTEMVSWLAAAEPRLERIATWNAVSNQYMIGINEALGYEIAGRPYRSVELPVEPPFPGPSAAGRS